MHDLAEENTFATKGVAEMEPFSSNPPSRLFPFPVEPGIDRTDTFRVDNSDVCSPSDDWLQVGMTSEDREQDLHIIRPN